MRRKEKAAKQRKEIMKTKGLAKLNDSPSSPRKMRLVIDLIRGQEVNKALAILKYLHKDAARSIEKLLMSALSNWQAKNEGVRLEDVTLIVKEAFVDQGRTLKRLRPAPQGRGYRVRKRSNHVTLVLDTVTEVKAEKKVKEKTETKA